jgi:hypothetical protein
MFGYSEPVEPTDADRAGMQRAEAITDLIVAPAYAVLSEAERDSFVVAVLAIDAALTP